MCQGLKFLVVSFSAGDLEGAIPVATLERYLKFMKGLQSLFLIGAVHTRHTIQHLSTLPSLKHCYSVNHAEPPRLTQGNRVERQTGGFKILETLEIRDTAEVLNFFLSTIGDCSPLRDLSITDNSDAEKMQDDGIFPDRFSPRGLKNISITLSYIPSQSLAANILAAFGRFYALTGLRLIRCTLAITDDRVVTALRNCSNLERLQLGDEVGISGNGSRLSLGCLAPILSQCPHLQSIGGCFDLDQEKIPTRVTSPHPKLNKINLAGSYFVTPEPLSWISPTVGYLSSLTRKPCDISLYVFTWIDPILRDVEREVRSAKWIKSAFEFQQCVDAVNSMKLHMSNYASEPGKSEE